MKGSKPYSPIALEQRGIFCAKDVRRGIFLCAKMRGAGFFV